MAGDPLKKPWNIKDSLSNLFPIGEYEFRADSFTPAIGKEGSKVEGVPTVKVQWTCVTEGENKDKKQFSQYFLRTDLIGILGAFLASTQAFEEDEELPEDADTLCRVLTERLGGKVFAVDYKHRAAGSRVYPDFEVTGPSMAAFR